MSTTLLERVPLPRISLPSLPRLTVRSTEHQRRFEFRIGIAAILVTVGALLAAVGAYVIPFGQTVYRADFANSGDLRAGDDVRIAGITLGKVRAVTLVGDHAEISFDVDSKVHIGLDTTLRVKLMTPIGGRYLAVQPAGSGSAAGKIIPREHSKTPYDLSAALEDATPALAGIDAGKLRESISKLAGAFDQQPQALNDILTNVNSLSSIVAARRAEFSRALDIAKTYLEVVMNKMDRIQLAGQHVLDLYRVIAANREGLIRIIGEIRRAFDYITPIFDAADKQLGPVLEPLYDTIDKAVADLVNNKDALAGLDQNLVQLLDFFAKNTENPYVTVDQSGAVVTDTPLCPAGKPGC
ncbi:MCE family protein [Nocardia sp. NPDC059240]|uniref:MCE family protein n=1 Tax=Nocardia sp. NPDC059240 TaxID=3346786 RepID=UPI0036B91822